MAGVRQDPRVLQLVGKQGFVGQLDVMLDQLARCQKSLNEFLEEKRSQFPRFYFIGDDDLLEILGQATDPTVIQSHLRKLYAGIHTVGFDGKKTAVTEMHSQSGELVPLKTPVKISAAVEAWLANLTEAMRSTLQRDLEACAALKDGSRDPTRFPSQILCAAEQVGTYTNVQREMRREG